MRNNRQPAPSIIHTSQPILPFAHHVPQNLGKEYDTVEKLHVTPTKISLWELIQTFSTYHEMLKEALNKMNIVMA